MAKQWQIRRGTTAENNDFTGALGEVTMNTTTNDLRVHDGATQGGFPIRTLVFAQYPTAENNYTWAFKYSDGWVEQGGITGAVNGTGTTASVILPVTMSNAYYSVYVTITRPGNPDYRDQFLVAGNRSTTGFTVYSNWAGSANGSKDNLGQWMVKGMAA